jgi:hypothetical protein
MTILATEDSRQYAGTLTLTTYDDVPVVKAFEKQAFSVELNPAIESKGDELTMLNGNVLGADESVKWTMKLGVVQDFMDPEGFLEFCRTHALERVAAEWVPNSEVDAPTIGGDITIRPGKYGGATKLRLTSEVEFPVLGDPTVVHPA